jgi:hypothetical protein
MAATDPAKIELALQLCALNSGNVSATITQLKEQVGMSLQRKTLERWIKGPYSKRYRELYEQHEEGVRGAAAVVAREIASKSADLTDELLERTREKMDEIDPRDLAPSARAVSQVHASMTEKAQLLTGQPTQRVDHGELHEILGELRQMGVLPAAEVVDAELVEDERKALPA